MAEKMLSDERLLSEQQLAQMQEQFETNPYAPGSKRMAAKLFSHIAAQAGALATARWGADESMLQYDMAQKRACDAEQQLAECQVAAAEYGICVNTPVEAIRELIARCERGVTLLAGKAIAKHRAQAEAAAMREALLDVVDDDTPKVLYTSVLKRAQAALSGNAGRDMLARLTAAGPLLQWATETRKQMGCTRSKPQYRERDTYCDVCAIPGLCSAMAACDEAKEGSDAD